MKKSMVLLVYIATFAKTCLFDLNASFRCTFRTSEINKTNFTNFDTLRLRKKTRIYIRNLKFRSNYTSVASVDNVCVSLSVKTACDLELSLFIFVDATVR